MNNTLSMSPRAFGITLLFYAAFSALLRLLSLWVPVFKIPFLAGNVAGWILLGLLSVIGVRMLLRKHWHFTPLVVKQYKRFKAIRRGYLSFLLLFGLVAVAALDDLVVGKRALIVSYEGKLYFPFATDVLPATTFGGEEASETDYRELQREFRQKKSKNWLIMPPVPYDPKLDTPEVIAEVGLRDGLVVDLTSDQPFNGRAYTVFRDQPDAKRQEWVFRRGVRNGEMRGWDLAQEQVE